MPRRGRSAGARRRWKRAAATGLIAVACLAAEAGGSGATRADLDAARRRLARMESEYALAQTRKPYLVLDAGARLLSVRLMGMTMREVPIQSLEARGLLPAGAAAEGTAPLRVAAIMTLKEKEGDPRLTPLSAEQIEAGADDENAADALPPPTPAEFRLFFKQSLVVPVESRGPQGAMGGAWAGLRRRLSRLFGPGERPEQKDAKLMLSVRLAEEAAQELYRSLLPGERILVLPPAGLVLPDIGQELPRSLRPGRAPTPPPAGPQAAPGVPFRIPAPVEAGAPSNGEPAAPLPAEELAPPGSAVGEPTPAPAQRLDEPPPAAPQPGDSNASDLPQSTPAPASGPQ